MKTILLLVSSLVMMVVMYLYFIGICLYALVALPFIKLKELAHTPNKRNQFAGI